MNFGENIKKVRTERNMTQQQMADKLLVSRQAVSNWENDRNLPDIEMLINIALTFEVSLDELILGGHTMNNMTEKLIKDGSETRRASLNVKLVRMGLILFALGILAFICGLLGPVHRENFFVDATYAFFFAGVVTFVFTGVKNIFQFAVRKHNR
ncbi:MAG: helix-turn-helix transcriptional regulator [Bacillota bacterium]|nr:helix-turn-helix transcriptional regulator [Bacillota bacterium]